MTELYLFLTNIPAPYTFYKDIFKLKPGHYLLIRDKQVSNFKYWELPEIDENNMLSDKTLVHEKFKELLTDSVRIRMRSDVPFGATVWLLPYESNVEGGPVVVAGVT